MRKRNIQIPIRLNENENNHLEHLVEESGVTREELIRRLILGKEIKARMPSEFKEVKRLLANISNNINQIAFMTNATGNIHYEQVETLTRLIDKSYDHIISLQ